MASSTDLGHIPIFYRIPFGWCGGEIVSGYLEKKKCPGGSKQKRFYGHFECSGCGVWWNSDQTWQGYTQECKKCRVNSWPIKVYHLEQSADTEVAESHITELCGKYRELGHNCHTGASLQEYKKNNYPRSNRKNPNKFETCFKKQYELFSYEIRLESHFIQNLYEKLKDEWNENSRTQFFYGLKDAEKEWREKGRRDMVRVCQEVLRNFEMKTSTSTIPQRSRDRGMAAATPDNSIGDDEFNRIELEFYLNAETHHYDRSVLFIGITGQGKSSLCNFLMNEQKFQIEDSMMSCPEDSKQALTNLKGTNYLLVDIPGVCDTARDPKVVLSELVKAFFFVRKQGISAIAVVIQPKEKMKPDEYDALEDFLRKLAPNMWKHVFVVFTHEKETLEKYNSGGEYIDHVLQHKYCPKFLKFISESCSNRFMHVECKTLSEDNQYWEMKISEFTHYVESIMKSNSFLQMETMQDLEQRYQNILNLKSKMEKLIETKIVLSAKQEPTSEDVTWSIQVEDEINKTDEEMLNETKEMKLSFLQKLGLLAAVVGGGIAGVLGLGAVGYLASGFIISTVAPNALLLFGMAVSKFLK